MVLSTKESQISEEQGIPSSITQRLSFPSAKVDDHVIEMKPPKGHLHLSYSYSIRLSLLAYHKPIGAAPIS